MTIPKIVLDTHVEKRYWDSGFVSVAGVDEVGRGCLAGPVVAGAVVFPKDHTAIKGINDSKMLTQKKRKSLELKIRNYAADIGIGQIEAEEIDRIGIVESIKKAMRLACEKIGCHTILVDGPSLLGLDKLCKRSEAIIHGDAKVYSIAAASIVAKVYRDNLITGLAKMYPMYGFEHHKGYGTKAHFEAIRTYGLTPLHRRSFIVRP